MTGELQIPDKIGEVIGWWAWTIVAPSTPYPRLRSATATHRVGLVNAIWPTDRWFRAVCTAGHTDVPHAGCSCGLYAATTLDHLLDYGYAQFGNDGVTAIGQVGFAGKVIDGTQGHKAEKGRIVRLYVPLSQHALGAKLAELYRVPVELATWWAQDPRLCGRGNS